VNTPGAPGAATTTAGSPNTDEAREDRLRVRPRRAAGMGIPDRAVRFLAGQRFLGHHEP
jgi:hypothetical protein